MEHVFKIVNADELDSIDLFNNIDNLKDITGESMAGYMTYGVWIFFGRKPVGVWECLQVGQSSNIGSEIISDVKCLSGEIKTKEGIEYINQFGQKVPNYTYNVYLSPREQIYEHVGKEYNKFVFVCICCGEIYKDEKKAIEKYAAWKFRALFWRNGGSFKEAKENVQEPEDIENIKPTIKDNIDKMVKKYNEHIK